MGDSVNDDGSFSDGAIAAVRHCRVALGVPGPLRRPDSQRNRLHILTGAK